MMFGTWFAVAYAVPRQVADTVCAKTSWRPKPTMFDTIVIAPMRTAARPIPLPARGTGPISCARPVSAAVSCASVTGGWQSSPGRQTDVGPGWPGPRPDDPGCPSPSRRREPAGLAAEHVEPVQRRRPPDDLGEAHLLAGRGERDDPGQDGDPARPRQAHGRGGAEHGPERVGPRVAQHGPLPEVLACQRKRRTQRDRGQRGSGNRARQHRTSQHRARQHRARPDRAR